MPNGRLKPAGYEDVLSDYKACLFDGWCGEPVGWGFELVERIREERFEALGKRGKLECAYPKWFLIAKSLTRDEAIRKYGPVANEEFGPRGGWKSVTFGDKKFLSRKLRAE